jgi:hypothetical protein
MRELHEGPVGGHFATEITQRKILDVGYWWANYVHRCAQLLQML